MRTLIVGGTGGIGGFVALALARAGHEVALAARHRAGTGSPVAELPILLGSYSDGEFTRDQLGRFDNIVFSACNDPRQLPPGSTAEQEAAYYHRVNSVGVPRFIALSREAAFGVLPTSGASIRRRDRTSSQRAATSSRDSQPMRARERSRGTIFA